MLSAVELHSGGGSGFYSHHHHPTFGRVPASSDSVQYTTTPSQMSGTEFARPKPKSIGSNSATLNGLSPSAISPPTHKYSHHHLNSQQQQHQQQQPHEQNGPVNLAVNHHHQRQQHSSSEKEHPEKEIDVVGLGNGGNPFSTTNSTPNGNSSSRLSSFPAGLGSNAYQALNYNFYGNRYNNPLFPPRYPQHHTSRPTYLDAYSPAAYLTYSASAYSSAPPSPLTQSSVESLSPIGGITHKSSNERSHSMSSLSNGHHLQHHPYQMKEKEPKSAGPRLTGNVENQINNFKVPSGKEGSLKHRILTTTRPHENNKHGTINHPAHRSSNNNNSNLNFTRGSLIELSNGSFRRVEDLRTEDFVLSAEKSQDLQLADSTVVKILPANNNFIMITFSYDNNRSKVDIEAKMEHPFFVYGQGWASCDPESSMQAFGLKCQRLQVGDVCISLKPREQKLSPPLSPMAQKRPRELYQPHLPPTQQQQKDEMMPQNLSRRPSNTPEQVQAASAISSYSSSIYNLQMSLFAAAASQGRMPAAAYASFLNQQQEEVQKAAVAAAAAAHLSHESNTSSLNNNNNINNNNSPDKLPIMSATKNDDYADDLQARKRRWSAPDIDADEQQQLRKISNN